MVYIMLVELVARELVGAALQPELVDGDEGQEEALAAAMRAVAAHRRVRNIALDRVAYRAAMTAAFIRHVVSPRLNGGRRYWWQASASITSSSRAGSPKALTDRKSVV